MARSTAALSRLGSLVVGGGMHASGGLCASATRNAGGIPCSLLASRHFSEASPPERTSFGNLQDAVRRLDLRARTARRPNVPPVGGEHHAWKPDSSFLSFHSFHSFHSFLSFHSFHSFQSHRASRRGGMPTMGSRCAPCSGALGDASPASLDSPPVARLARASQSSSSCFLSPPFESSPGRIASLRIYTVVTIPS